MGTLKVDSIGPDYRQTCKRVPDLPEMTKNGKKVLKLNHLSGQFWMLSKYTLRKLKPNLFSNLDLHQGIRREQCHWRLSSFLKHYLKYRPLFVIRTDDVMIQNK